MKCLVCKKDIIPNGDLCYECKEHHKKYPKEVREYILNFFKKKGGKHHE